MVAGPDVRRLRELLVADGADVSGDADIVVRDRSGEDIGRVITPNQLVRLRADAGRVLAGGSVLRAHRGRRRSVVSGW